VDALDVQPNEQVVHEWGGGIRILEEAGKKIINFNIENSFGE